MGLVVKTHWNSSDSPDRMGLSCDFAQSVAQLVSTMRFVLTAFGEVGVNARFCNSKSALRGKILLGLERSFASTVADVGITVDYCPPIRAKEGNGELG